VVLLISTVSLI